MNQLLTLNPFLIHETASISKVLFVISIIQFHKINGELFKEVLHRHLTHSSRDYIIIHHLSFIGWVAKRGWREWIQLKLGIKHWGMRLKEKLSLSPLPLPRQSSQIISSQAYTQHFTWSRDWNVHTGRGVCKAKDQEKCQNMLLWCPKSALRGRGVDVNRQTNTRRQRIHSSNPISVE